MIRTLHIAVAILATTVMASTSFAQARNSPQGSTPARPAAAARPAVPSPLQASGALTKWDDKTNMITVKTDRGEMMFPILATTRLEENNHAIAKSALSGRVNHDVRVRYTEENGTKTVLSVTVGAVARTAQK